MNLDEAVDTLEAHQNDKEVVENIEQPSEQEEEKLEAQNMPVLGKLESVEELSMEDFKLENRLPTFDFPPDTAKIQQKPVEESKHEPSDSSSSGDSDFDMLEAFEKSEELQDYFREQVREELKVIGPPIFEQLKAELNIQENPRNGLQQLPPEIASNLKVSWHNANEAERQ